MDSTPPSQPAGEREETTAKPARKAGRPRRMAGNATTWKAMSHPLRQQILRQLGRGPATSTTIAAALGENTGTTSYHLRVLADAGLIEEIRDRGSGRERWWRAVPLDLRSNPDGTGLTSEDRAALEQWKSALAPREFQLLRRLLDESGQYGRWAGASRASGYYTADDLDALKEDYIALLNKYRHSAEDAPPGARLMHLRMFFLPDEASPGDR